MRQASRRKYHYVYRITRKSDGKFYIGIHSTDDLDDGYFGSGKRIKYSINKHGKDAHTKEILEFHPDREIVKLREAELVNEECLNDPLCLNLCLGGGSNEGHSVTTREKISLAGKGKKRSTETRQKMSEAAKGKPKSEAMKKKLSASRSGKYFGPSKEEMKNRTTWNRGKKTGPLSEETKAKLSAIGKGRTPWNKGMKTV